MGYEHFNTNLITKDIEESSTKNLIPIPNECIVVLENGSQSTEPVNDNSSIFTTISNPLSHVEFNSDESTSNHDTEKSDYLDEFYGPFIPIHILEEERTRREHADYINRMEKLFTINSCPHNSTNDNTHVKSFSSFPIPNQENEPRQEEIDVVSVTNDVLPPSDGDSDEEVDAVNLRVDNFIQNSEHEYSESEDSEFDNPLLPLPPPEPPDKEFDFKKEISVVRNVIVKFECIDARMKFDVFNDKNDVLSNFIFVIFAKEFSLLSAESEDTIFDPASILTSGVFVSISLVTEVSVAEVPISSGSIPTASSHAAEVPTVSIPPAIVVPTASLIFTTAAVATPYTRRKGKKKMVESDTPKKKKLQEQMDVEMARQLEKEMARDAQRMNEQIAMDAEIARIHAEEELQIMIDGLDRNNETVAKYLQEYHQFAVDLPIKRRIEFINDLVKYQEHYAKVLKYQTQQRKPLSRKQQKEFYMSVLKSHAGWKARHFKGMTLKEIKEKFDPVWKQIEDFIPIGSNEEGERFKRKWLRLEQDSAKKVKTSEEVLEEDLKNMTQLVPVEEVYVEALQLWALVKETLNIRQATSDKEKELWVELKRLFEPNVEDQLWTHTQTLMHDPVEWRLYDSCGVHHILSRDQEIFMDLDEFCGMKGIKREYSNAKTLQQNEVAERKNRTLIEAVRTMLADSLLRKEVYDQHYIVLPLWSSIFSTYKSSDEKPADDKPKDDTGSKTIEAPVNKDDQAYKDKLNKLMSQEKEASDALDALRKDNPGNVASTSGTFSAGGPSSPHPDAFIPANTLLHVDQDDSQILDLEDTAKLQKADFNNMESSTIVNLIPTHKVHIDHPKDQILGDPKSAVQTRGMAKKNSRAHALVSYIHKQRRTNHKDYENCLFVCFLLQMEPKKVSQALDVESWVEAMQEEFLGTIDKTFLSKKDKDDIMLVQVYVDDIIFGSTKKSLCDEFEALRHKRFQMSSIEELTFFLGLQVKQSEEGIFISQTSRPDIMFAVCACSRFYVTPKFSHLQDVKGIFRYLKGQPKLGLWYPRDSHFDFEAYSDSDYARANLDRKSTTGEYVATAHCCGQTEENAEFHQIVDFLSTCLINYALTVSPTIYASYIEQFWNAAISKTVNSVKQMHVIVDGKAVVILESSVRSDLLFNDEDALLKSEDNNNIDKTQSTAMSIDPISQENGSGHTVGSEEDMMEQETDLTDFVPPTPYNLPLSGGHTPGSDEDLVIKRLQKKVKRLEKKQTERTLGMKLFKIGTSKKKTLDKENVSRQEKDESNRTEELSLSDKGSGETKVFDYTTAAEKDVNAAEPFSTDGDAVNAASVIPDVSVAGPSVSAVGPFISTTEDIFEDEMTTIDDILMAIRSTRPRTTSVVTHDVKEEPRRATPPPTVQSQDKGKGKMVEFEPISKNPIKASIDADALLAEKLQQEEREQFTLDEQARMLVDLIAERKSFFAAQRAEHIRNKSPTKAQLRNKMVTYLKHMGKYAHNQLKSKRFEEIQMLYERE
uniref:Reverse transcriptase Ty1/copia-type domain-containing protein n=1 Tax=Tanacetum cinerariifolium TaxID=118510 RepID=A0A6L2NGJ0_TANCI|nr:hypothetical protein [Tanacetum cinerariifolium]